MTAHLFFLLSLIWIMTDTKLTNVLNVEELLIIEDCLIPWAELDTVKCPDECVILIEEALILPVRAVLRTLSPIFRRGMRVSARGKKTTCGLKKLYERDRGDDRNISLLGQGIFSTLPIFLGGSHFLLLSPSFLPGSQFSHNSLNIWQHFIPLFPFYYCKLCLALYSVNNCQSICDTPCRQRGVALLPAKKLIMIGMLCCRHGRSVACTVKKI